MTNKELPAKTCTIDQLVTMAEDVNKVIEGKKTATRRNGRYADVGEIMILKEKKIRCRASVLSISGRINK